MPKSKSYYLRKTHRWLGVIIGIQFLVWTISGIYFSWNDIDEIHGDHLREFPEPDIEIGNVISPSKIILLNDATVTIKKAELIEIFDKPYYRIRWQDQNSSQTGLFNARTGNLRKPLTIREAERLSNSQFRPDASIQETNFIEKVPEGHEYRHQPLPAWQIIYNDKAQTRVYVSAGLGEVVRFRTERWRWFDWLWMWHIMDYDQRDNFNNVLLQSFSILGLVTILSGFILFGVTIRYRRRRE